MLNILAHSNPNYRNLSKLNKTTHCYKRSMMTSSYYNWIPSRALKLYFSLFGCVCDSSCVCFSGQRL